uniref:Uncharacterized protein n=1 Tax=Fagus sylvatica TaxID=28930 RepID=A0A2N9F0B7_FAGSY
MFMAIFVGGRALQQSQMFDRQRTWGFFPSGAFLGYPLAIWVGYCL